MNPKRFTVHCVAEIDSCIGKSYAHIVAHDATDWDIECITNDHFGELSGEHISDGLWREIAEGVQDYFSGVSE